MGSGRKIAIGQKRTTTKVTGSLKRQLPWDLTQFSIVTVDAKRSIYVGHLGCELSTEELDGPSLKVILKLFQVIVISCDGYCKVLPLAKVRRDV